MRELAEIYISVEPQSLEEREEKTPKRSKFDGQSLYLSVTGRAVGSCQVIWPNTFTESQGRHEEIAFIGIAFIHSVAVAGTVPHVVTSAPTLAAFRNRLKTYCSLARSRID